MQKRHLYFSLLTVILMLTGIILWLNQSTLQTIINNFKRPPSTDTNHLEQKREAFNELDNILYLETVVAHQEPDSGRAKRVFVVSESEASTVYIAKDITDKSTWTKVASVPGSYFRLEFVWPKHLLMHVSGGHFSDILLFDSNGKVISHSIFKDNQSILSGWLINKIDQSVELKKPYTDTHVKLMVYKEFIDNPQVAGQTAEVLLNIETGNVVEDSFQIIDTIYR